jgi:octaprenyl-diphosphate synthase
LAANAPDEKRNAITRFGDYLGICFQIKDDIFDYTPKADIGKPTFNDIREGKFTLPLIYSIGQLSKEEYDYIMKSVRDGNFDDDVLERIRRCVENYGGIDYSERKIEYYRTKAVETLSVFDDSPEKEALIDTLDYVIRRNI